MQREKGTNPGVPNTELPIQLKDQWKLSAGRRFSDDKSLYEFWHITLQDFITEGRCYNKTLSIPIC